jgi:hypothetical protein
MHRLTISLPVAVLAACLQTPAAAQDAAGNLDHLLCYRMKDPLMTAAHFDLLAQLQPEFSRAGCELVRDEEDEQVSSEFCVPASKRNVVATSHDPNAIGAPLSDDYVCYRMQCAAGAKPPSKIVGDQFGDRQVRFGPATRICVPATKRSVPCGQTDVTKKGVPVCGGACAAPAQACQLDKRTGVCGCAPAPCGAKPDSTGMCGGGCADPAAVCTINADNRCQCVPRPCGANAVGQCGGACADPTHQCVPSSGGTCECAAPQSSGCGLDPASGECGGECPPGLFCLPPTGGGNSCLCREFGGLG